MTPKASNGRFVKKTTVAPDPIPATSFTAESRAGMTFSYDIVDTPVVTRPNSGRTPEINPHQAGIDRAVEMFKGDDLRSLAITVPTEEVKLNVGWLRKGGKASDVTVLTVVTDNGDGSSRITFRATKRIVRARKNKAENNVVVPTIAAGETTTAEQTGF